MPVYLQSPRAQDLLAMPGVRIGRKYKACHRKLA
jgi:hypothetical protein